MSTKIELNEIRDLSNRINITFSFIKQNGKPIAKNLVYLIPVYIIIGIVMGIYVSSIYSTITLAANSYYSDFDMENMLSLYLIILLIGIAASIVSMVAMLFVSSYVSLYNESEDGVVDTSTAWQRVKESFLGVLGGSILAGLAMTVGLLLCILPGIWVAVSFSLFIPAYVAGKSSQVPQSVMESLDESRRLINQDWFGAFGFLFVIGIIVGVFSFALGIPTSIIQSMTGLLHETPILMSSLYAITYAISYVGGLFFSAILYIAIAFLYYDYKERKYGTSLQHKIDNIGKNDTV